MEKERRDKRTGHVAFPRSCIFFFSKSTKQKPETRSQSLTNNIFSSTDESKIGKQKKKNAHRTERLPVFLPMMWKQGKEAKD
jgi:hypothetical protein